MRRGPLLLSACVARRAGGWLPIGNLVVRTLRPGGHPTRLSQSAPPLQGGVNKLMKAVI